MKIKPEHVEYMQVKFKGFMDRNPGAVADHRARLSPYNGDLEMRMRWDMLRAAVGFEWVSDNLYTYANDDHIDTALRALQRELRF